MIEVKDRVPTYPGRVKLIPVAGQANTYDLVRADEPIEAGTPINKALFQSLLADIDAIRQQVNDKILELSQRVRVGDLVDGAEFGLYESGVLVPFIKLASSYNGEATPLVIRKNCVSQSTLLETSEVSYTNCKIDRWLSATSLPRLDPATRSVIPNATIITTGTSGTTTIQRKIFLLSLTEYQMSSTAGIPSEGNYVSYLSSAARRTARLNGTLVNHWTRSVDSLRNIAAYVNTSGNHATGAPSTVSAGIRPAFRLPPDFEVTTSIPSTSNTMATTEELPS